MYVLEKEGCRGSSGRFLKIMESSIDRRFHGLVLVFFPFSPQRRSVDPKRGGGFIQGRGARDHAGDVLALDSVQGKIAAHLGRVRGCLLYTSDAADE